MPDSGLDSAITGRRLGVLIVGMGGAVATTAAAGIEMLRAGSNDMAGLPLAGVGASGIAAYKNLHFAGWDLHGEDLESAVREHRVLEREQSELVGTALSNMKPWPAVGSLDFCKNVDGGNKIVAKSHREAVDRIRDDIRRYREDTGIADVVMVNLASVERWPDKNAVALNTPEGFEAGLDSSDPVISPAMLYAYAAITEGVPYGNFTPSLAADIPALTALATRRNVPVCGKDGKTGQTFIKTVLAPAFRSRSLYVEGWFSTNILGNRDGLAVRLGGEFVGAIHVLAEIHAADRGPRRHAGECGRDEVRLIAVQHPVLAHGAVEALAVQIPTGEVQVAVGGNARGSHAGERQAGHVVAAGAQHLDAGGGRGGDCAAETHDEHTQAPPHCGCV